MLILRNFLTFKMASFIDAHLLLLSAVWIVLAVVGMWSVFSRPMNSIAKFIWIVAIFCLPVLGLTVYVFNCLLNADWDLLRQMGFFPGGKKVLNPNSNSSKI
ncbi:MAG: PLDc_N domain-containing protein [Verrucomicrobiaceae bacterium]|nr:PLDc_N domain-containing protein [Verrucomicrobiaceae bacterium]